MSLPVADDARVIPRSNSSSTLNSESDLQRRLLSTISPAPPRLPKTQNLAVLLAREHWKPDREATKCDSFHCREIFSRFWGRKHHCRRCGGVFCQDCSAQVTSLLDTSKMAFIYPPEHVLVETLATKQNPMQSSRVCDDCFELLHGTIPERQKRLREQSLVTYTSPSLTRARTTSFVNSGYTSSGRSSSSMVVGAVPPKRSSSVAVIPTPIPEDNDPYAGYPLRVPSAICKANGGGRWVPTPQPVRYDFRPPGGKAIYELKMERQDERRRRRLENPIIIDGEFAMRRGPRTPSVRSR